MFETRQLTRLEPVDSHVERERTLGLYASAYRIRVQEALEARAVESKLGKRMLACHPSGCLIERYWRPIPEIDQPSFRTCRHKIVCPFCRYRFIRSLVRPEGLLGGQYLWAHPEDQVVAYLSDFECGTSDGFESVRQAMRHRVKNLQRRLSQRYIKFGCLNVEWEQQRGFFYRFRQAVVMLEDPDLETHVWTKRVVPYANVLRAVFRYPDTNLESPAEYFFGLCKCTKMRFVDLSR